MSRDRLPVIRRRIAEAKRRVNQETNAIAGRHRGKGPDYAGGLSSEGFHGGYIQALRDVELLLNGVLPDTRGWWPAAVSVAEHQEGSRGE